MISITLYLKVVLVLFCTAKTNCVDTTITNLLENKEEMLVEATGTSAFGTSKSSSYSSGSAPTIKVSLFNSTSCHV